MAITNTVVQLYSDKEKTDPVAPITSTKAVYDEDDNRLDNTLTSISNALSEAKDGVVFTPTLANGFTLASWGVLTGVKFGKLCIVSCSGVKSNTSLSSDTTAITIPYTIKVSSAVCAPTAGTGRVVAIALAGRKAIVFNNAPANENIFVTLAFAVE